MKAVFSIVGLLVVLVIVAMLAKKQLHAGVAPAPAVTDSTSGASAPTGTPPQQVQQFKGAVEGAMQQARPMPDDVK